MPNKNNSDRSDRLASEIGHRILCSVYQSVTDCVESLNDILAVSGARMGEAYRRSLEERDGGDPLERQYERIDEVAEYRRRGLSIVESLFRAEDAMADRRSARATRHFIDGAFDALGDGRVSITWGRRALKITSADGLESVSFRI